jgi:glycosidase
MWGSDDPFNRKPMLWKELEPYEEEGAVVDEELLEYYKKLISIRKNYPVLRTGLFSSVLIDDKRNIYVYHRYDKYSNVIVILNNSEKTQKVKIEKINGYENIKYFDPFDKKTKVYKYPIVVSLEPYTGKILLPVK